MRAEVGPVWVSEFGLTKRSIIKCRSPNKRVTHLASSIIRGELLARLNSSSPYPKHGRVKLESRGSNAALHQIGVSWAYIYSYAEQRNTRSTFSSAGASGVLN